MHLLILGGKSFIGSRLAKYILSNTPWTVETVGSDDVDLTHDNSVQVLQKKITEQTTIVFCSTISRLREDSFDAFQKNIAMARNVAYALSGIKYRNIIFFSSIDVYGRPPANPITEKSCINPFGYYGLAKFASEHILMNYLGRNSKLAILRLPGVYALDDGDQSALGMIFNKLKHDLPIMLSGRGNQLRAYLNIVELGHIIQSIISENWSGLLNLVFSRSFSLHEMTMIMKNFLQSSSPIKEALENGTEFDIVIDTAKLHSEFPKIPTISLEQYMNEHCSYVKSICSI